MEEEEESFQVVVHSVGGDDRFRFGGLELIANELGEHFSRREKFSFTAEGRLVEFEGYADGSLTEPDASIILLMGEEEGNDDGWNTLSRDIPCLVACLHAEVETATAREATVALGSDFTVVKVDDDFGRTCMNWLIRIIGGKRESAVEESGQSYEYQPLDDVEDAEEVERIDDFSKLNMLQATSEYVHRDQRIDESAAFLQALASSSDED
ncbi:hypothetical protein NDN08_002892 [Rhodosorus marinus]|uniref:Uncharacterized protein n=1 Tax=Rhodosorus marinus TaxID=101924 RepID=A0AAV8UWH4_9RHOD|nr:hypothetical protein NDN08_002892 [Rhodosorus marinus]